MVADPHSLERIPGKDLTPAQFDIVAQLSEPSITAVTRSFRFCAFDLEDIRQETYTKAWLRRHQFKGGSAKFSTWVARIAVNLCLDQVRRAKKRNETPLLARGEDDTFSVEPPQAPDQEQRVGVREVVEAIASLNPEARDLLLLHFSDGFKTRELAEMTGASENYIKTKISRARHEVAERLSGTPRRSFPKRGPKAGAVAAGSSLPGVR